MQPTPGTAGSDPNVTRHEKASLSFPNLQALWAFVREIGATELEMNAKKLTLLCTCSKDHIDLALKKYGAKRSTE